MDPASVWLVTEVVVPDAYSAVRQRVSDRSENQRLVAAVREDTGSRPGRGYKRWLALDATWADIAAPGQPQFDRLVDSLASAQAVGCFGRRAPDRDRAETLVRATIGHFLPTLNPSMAVAIADMRAGRRHTELLVRFDARSSYQDRLSAMPPAARLMLSEEQVEPGSAERLVHAVTDGDPSAAIGGLIRVPPPWLVDAPVQVVLAAGETATAFGLHEEAAEMFEKAADLGRDRHWNYARSAFEWTVAGEPGRSGDLFQRARAVEPGPWADVLEAACAGDFGRMREVISKDTALERPFSSILYVEALVEHGGRDACIAFLTDAVNRHPGFTSLSLRLAWFVLERSMTPGTTSRVQDERRVLALAIEGRDQRRIWHGPSADAVHLACLAALLGGDYEVVIRLGTVAPDGEALPEEAAKPEVQFAVAQAALMSGRTERANAVAEAASGFHQALIIADLPVPASAEENERSARYARAWDLATNDEEKAAVWLSAGRAGVDPVPGVEELQARTDETPDLVAALQDAGNGRFQEAIDRLRPLRDREAARRLLAGVYVQAGRPDDAVTELVNMADRFTNPQHLVRAIEVLVAEGRVDDAAKVADGAASQLAQAPVVVRGFVHEVRVASAHNRHAWHDMEVAVRAWIGDLGASSYSRWLLVQALNNQLHFETAWQVLQEAGGLEPETAVHAGLWVVLNARFKPGQETLSTALALCDRFPEDADLRTVAVNAYVLATDKSEIPPEDLVRWHALVRQRAERPAEGDTFASMTVPEDADERREVFRGLLEPQALQIKEMRENVRQGWPYALLAVAAGRTYTAALVHRAMGYLVPFTMHDEAKDIERRAAASAIDRRVVVDLSTLAIGWFIRDKWPKLAAAFTQIELTSLARHDLTATADSMRPRTPHSLGWDLTSDQPVRYEIPDEHLDRLDEHVQWMSQTAQSLDLRDWPLQGLPGEPDGQEAGPASWLAAVELAVAEGTPIWADDVGLRQLARNEGADAFGTADLLDALVAAERLEPLDRDTLIEQLRDEYCIDLPLDAAWIESRAARDGWRPGVAQFTFTRASTWQALPDALEVWRKTALRAGATSNDLVAPWVAAATLGLSYATGPPLATRLAAGLLAIAAEAVKWDPASYAICVLAASTVSRERGLPAPTLTALEMLFNLLSQQRGPDQAATTMAKLGSDLDDDDKAALRRLLFNLDS